jgi:hypothetical protein
MILLIVVLCELTLTYLYGVAVELGKDKWLVEFGYLPCGSFI